MSSNGSGAFNFFSFLFCDKQKHLLILSMQLCFRPQSLPDDEDPIALAALGACTDQLACLPLPTSNSFWSVMFSYNKS